MRNSQCIKCETKPKKDKNKTIYWEEISQKLHFKIQHFCKKSNFMPFS